MSRAQANRRNALVSTGPKTLEGKAASSRNALRHGIASALPVVPGLERPEDWEIHRAGILQSLSPVGALEEAFAERVALCSWRLQRVARYETAVTAVGLERVEDGEDQGGPSEATLEEVLHELEKKREVVQLWEGTLRLLTQLPDLPDEAAVNGDDVEGAFDDFNGALPESVGILRHRG
ncbi:MAG: hypothetical protein L0Z62_02460 [Gemmataceae bacterium]|nr:hypothetical protein [Gemmataceae bacterium]